MLLDLRGQFGQLDGMLDQLDGMLCGGFGQLFGYGAEIPGFRGKLGQLPGHSQQFGAQQPTTQGLAPFGLFIDNPVEVDDVVDGGRAGHSGSAPFGNHYTPPPAVLSSRRGKIAGQSYRRNRPSHPSHRPSHTSGNPERYCLRMLHTGQATGGFPRKREGRLLYAVALGRREPVCWQHFRSSRTCCRMKPPEVAETGRPVETRR